MRRHSCSATYAAQLRDAQRDPRRRAGPPRLRRAGARVGARGQAAGARRDAPTSALARGARSPRRRTTARALARWASSAGRSQPGLLREPALPRPARPDVPRVRGRGRARADRSARRARARRARPAARARRSRESPRSGCCSRRRSSCRAELVELAAELAESLARVGYEVEAFGKTSLAIKAVPGCASPRRSGARCCARCSRTGRRRATPDARPSAARRSRARRDRVSLGRARGRSAVGRARPKALLRGLDAVDCVGPEPARPAGAAAPAARRDRAPVRPLRGAMTGLDVLVPDALWLRDYGVRLGGARFNARMTVIKLRSGELIVHSPCAFDASLTAEVAALGRVTAIVAPGNFHSLQVPSWPASIPRRGDVHLPGHREAGEGTALRRVVLGDDAPACGPTSWRRSWLRRRASCSRSAFFHSREPHADPRRPRRAARQRGRSPAVPPAHHRRQRSARRLPRSSAS